MKNLFKNTYLRFAVILLTGFFLGYLIFGGHPEDSGHSHSVEEASQSQVWTCSMHPSVRDDSPGSCPICGMDLIPASEMNGDDDNFSLVMSESAIRLSEIQTVPVKKDHVAKTLRLPGRVEIDERNVTSVSAHFPGRITELNVNYTGAPIRKGEVMAKVYSPELVSAQRELLEALKREVQNPTMLNAAREKLRQWELSSAQIRQIEERGEVQRNLEIISPVDGFVTSRNVAREQYVDRGTVLFEVADLSKLWAIFEAYEEDLPWIAMGDSIRFHDRSNPSRQHSAVVSYIDPSFQSASRTIRIRASVSGENVRPEMILRGELEATMHEPKIQIPASAVLWTGPRSLAYIMHKNEESTRFEAREITLGVKAGDFYVVEEGLEEGEHVVFHGAFKIDSEMQLSDKFSMMNRDHGILDEHDDHAEDLERFDDVPDDFKEKLREAVAAYIAGKGALTESDRESAQNAFADVISWFDEIGEHGLSGSGHEAWMQSYSNMMHHLEAIAQTDDIEEVRAEFRHLSDELVKAVKQFGIDGVVYHQYCPMAFGDEGAYWISEEEEIRNPYLPETMLMCGEVIEALE